VHDDEERGVAIGRFLYQIDSSFFFSLSLLLAPALKLTPL
jgi:hypothetical protein